MSLLRFFFSVGDNPVALFSLHVLRPNLSCGRLVRTCLPVSKIDTAAELLPMYRLLPNLLFLPCKPAGRALLDVLVSVSCCRILPNDCLLVLHMETGSVGLYIHCMVL